MIRAFRKIGGAFKAIGRFIVRREVLAVAKTVGVFVPVLGLPLSIAIDYVEKAEKVFSLPGSGELKLAWVLKNGLAAFEDAGYREKRVRALIELALLILKDEAQVLDEKVLDIGQTL